jgi:hypothetical protein
MYISAIVIKIYSQLNPNLRNVGYNSLDRSDLMSKILFCFKEEIFMKIIHLDRVKQLISMRNSAVHYRVNSPEALQPSIEDLIGIWNQLSEVFNLTYGEPNKNQVQELANDFIDQWIA